MTCCHDACGENSVFNIQRSKYYQHTKETRQGAPAACVPAVVCRNYWLRDLRSFVSVRQIFGLLGMSSIGPFSIDNLLRNESTNIGKSSGKDLAIYKHNAGQGGKVLLTAASSRN